MTLRPKSNAIRLSAMTHRGLVREQNEDAIAVGNWTACSDMTEPEDLQIAELKQPLAVVIADGLGGHCGGELASRVVVDELPGYLEKTHGEAGIVSALNRVNERLFELSSQSPAVRGMGATVAGVLLDNGQAHVFNVGDARVYSLNSGKLLQLSIDDVPAPAPTGRRLTHAITQSLGGTDKLMPIQPHIRSWALSSQSGFLICSDGLTDALSDDEITIYGNGPNRDAVRTLFQRTFERGAPDNVSVIVIRLI